VTTDLFNRFDPQRAGFQEVPDNARPFALALPRNSFSPRLVARAGDVWRGLQDVVVEQSSSVGWPPARYAETKTMFVVRSMRVRHFGEVTIDMPLVGYTWPASARRGVLFTREVRLLSEQRTVCAASQEWAYLTHDMQPTRADDALLQAFTLSPGFQSVELPNLAPVSNARPFRFTLSAWHLWMDPFGHVNHPAYVDFCDEATSRALSAAGLDAQRLVPRAEVVHFKAAVNALDDVTVTTRLVGAEGAVAQLEHQLSVADKLVARAYTYRTLQGARDGEWMAALQEGLATDPLGARV
jgi:acyl-CoA thioesterase FadM